MAEYLNTDPAWVRIGWLALLVLGPGIFLYIIAWIAIPEADPGAETAPVATRQERQETPRLIIGSLLVLIGGSLLVDEYLPWMEKLIIPAVLIAVGTGVIIYSVRK